MSIFDAPADAPHQIHHEGETIVLTFSPGLPVTGQGTVKWTIPAPVHGCQTTDGRGAYCGFIVVVSDKPVQQRNAPVDGTFYTADPTLDPDMHAGDRLAEARVIGAYYEGEKRSRGEVLTTSFVVNDVKQNTPYYVAGYAVDCQGRYHTAGVRAYSDLYPGEDESDTPSHQTVVLDTGVIPTDGTGLDASTTYEFELLIDPTFSKGTERRIVKFSTQGINISTYGALIDEINKTIALADNPLQSPVPLNTGRYYWSGTQLFQWDGSSLILVDAIIEPTDPANPQPGDYWYDLSTNELKRWDVPTAGVWNVIPVTTYDEEPTSLVGGDDYWFDGTNGYRWCGQTWCQEPTTVSDLNPCKASYPTDCGVYWFDEQNGQLYTWNLEQNQWVQQYAVEWDTAPNVLTVGTFWFNDSNNQLSQWDGMQWIEIPLRGTPSTGSPTTTLRVSITETEPTLPNEDLLWFNPTNETLSTWDDISSQWTEVNVLIWPIDPTDVVSCDLWWNSSTDELFTWDTVHNEWDKIETFTISATDPTAVPSLEVGELWYEPSTSKLYRWDGVAWAQVEYFDNLTDPALPTVGDAWYKSSTDQWHIWDGAQWNEINPIDSVDDPFNIPQDTLWFDTTTVALFQRIGSSWISIPFSTTSLAPRIGTRWFDTTNDILMEWDGTQWIVAQTLATARLTTEGNIIFVTNFAGSTACIQILVPPSSVSGLYTGTIATGTAAMHEYVHYGIYDDAGLPQTTVSTEAFVFNHLSPTARIARQAYGTDGVKALPSYDSVGVGTDGSPDERRKLIESIRSDLGYPVVEVELTPYQIDRAIDLAIASLRKRGSAAYKRGFFFLDVQPGYQHYKLTDKRVGFNTVVTVMGAHRFTSAFLSSAHGSGVYGQIVLQHLYNMGTFDLLSYHLVSQYVEQMEHLFATRLMYHWNETSRTLSFYQSFTTWERILLDVTVERTEQDIMKDRWTRTWIEQYSLAESMQTLARIRGKYASLPGAGGGVSLDAADLMMRASEIKERLYQQLDDYIADKPEDYGMETQFIIG
jgi:hypothetical protein